MKTVGELIHSLDLEDVLATLKRLYTGPNESEEGYRTVWAKLLNMQPANTTITIILTKREEDWIDVSGYKRGDEDQMRYGIEFVDWAEWLSMEIDIDPEIRQMSDTEKLAHCLYEMTWAGYDQEHIAECLEDIVDAKEEVMAMTEEQRSALSSFPPRKLQ